MHKDTTCVKNCALCGAEFYRDKRNTWEYWGKAKFCSRSCSGQYGANIIREKLPTLASAFWQKVIRGGDNDCWQWSGTKDKDGYPLLTFKKKQRRAARVAVIITGREIKETDHACHACGNNWCCNPSHIYPGTPVQNNADKILHGTHRTGSKIHSAILDETIIPEIRNSTLSNPTLGMLYGVTASAICQVKNRKTWKHVL